MLPYWTKPEKSLEVGQVQGVFNPLRTKNLTDCLSLCNFEDGWLIHKDGSVSVGFQATLFEEEQLDEDGFIHLVHEFAAACKRLPVHTQIHKLDIYYDRFFELPIPEEGPFFYRKSLAPYHHRPILAHQSYFFLRFFVPVINPVSSFLGLGGRLFSHSFLRIDHAKQMANRAMEEFMASVPTGITLRRLDDVAHEQILYQCANLCFHRKPIGFERSYRLLPDGIVMGDYVKSVSMKNQAESVYCFRKNTLGAQGVTGPFMGPLTHALAFPHIISQQITRIPDQAFRRGKSLELEYSAQLKFGVRGKELASHIQQRFLALEKELQERDSQIVQHSYTLLAWHPSKVILQNRIDQIKSAFAKSEIEAREDGEDTASLFFSMLPGGGGFSEGNYMPIETAVAYTNFVTPRKGDGVGILLHNRQGEPIYYDPFKYSLDNQHAFVFGPSGSGKSFFNGKMIKDRYYAGHTVVVIDSGGTYRTLFHALGGRYIEYKADQPLQLNPFLIKRQDNRYQPSQEKIVFLVNFIATLWKGNPTTNPLTEVEQALMAKFLKAYYTSLSAEIQTPNLSGFCTWLAQHIRHENLETSLFDLKNFLIVTEPFTSGIYRAHFHAQEEIYLADSKLIGFELESIQSDRKLYPLVVKVLFDTILHLVANQPDQKKFIDIEEGWKMLDDSSQEYIESFFRKGRKTNTSIRIITQNVDEIKHSPIAGAMKNNAATFILLYNDKESVRQEIAEFLGMHAFDIEKYASLRRRDSYLGGYREVWIKEMDRSSVWRVESSLYEHALLTSRPDERNAIRALYQQTGSLEQAVSQWVEQITQCYSLEKRSLP